MSKRKRDDTDLCGKPAKNSRSFNKKWLETFNWLTYDSNANAMFCKICQKHNQKNNFVTPGSTNFRKSAVVEHSSTNDHVQSLKNETVVKDNQIVTLLDKANETVDEAMCNLFRTAYFVARENLPIEKYQSLNNLTKLNGAVITSKLYQEDNACSEFINIISDLIEENILAEIKCSPAIGIMIDESTDLSTQKHLILYISYLKSGTLQIHFAKLINVTSATAVSITAQLIAYFKTNNVDLTKIYGMGSDGAAVMIGKHGGVSQLLKETCPHLIEMHCVAHRLALACVDMSKEIPDIKFMESIISSLYSYFKRSPSNLAELRSWQMIVDDPLINPLDVHKVRWLSMGNALDNLRRSVVSIISMISDQGDSDIVANSLENSMTTYKFLFLLNFLSDLFGKINIFSKSLQKRDLSYAEVKQLVDSFLVSIQAEYLSDSPTFGPLLSEFIKATENDDCKSYNGIEFTKHPRDVHLQSRAVKCARIIHQNVTDRFPDNDIFEAFSVFDTSYFPANISDLASYGIEELNKLSVHYGPQDNKTPVVNPDELQREWGILKYMIFTNFKGLSASDLLVKLVPMKDQFPNVIQLMEISRILPVSSVEFHGKILSRLNYAAG